jgi:acyl carrier protein
MTSGHPWAADGFFGGGTALFLVKFWTWEEARRQPLRRKLTLQAGVTLLWLMVFVIALFWNHAINRAAASEQAKPAPPQVQPSQPAASTIDNHPKRSATTADEITALLSEQLQVDKAEVKPEKDLVLDLGATPLDKTEIVMQIETAYDIQIPSKDARKFKSVGDIINYIEHREHTGKTSTTVATPTTINQTAIDSDCSNFVAGANAQIKCETERKNHAKDKTSR